MVKAIAKGVNALLDKNLQAKKVIVSSSLDYLNRPRIIDNNYFDHIRLSGLELVRYEIYKKNLKGNVAELGVYKGKFAKHINTYFPDRTLYLFDTFEGFDTKDVAAEKSNGFSSGEQDFSNTSVEAVLKLMPHPEKCVPVKGFFRVQRKIFKMILCL